MVKHSMELIYMLCKIADYKTINNRDKHIYLSTKDKHYLVSID